MNIVERRLNVPKITPLMQSLVQNKVIDSAEASRAVKSYMLGEDNEFLKIISEIKRNIPTYLGDTLKQIETLIG